MSRRGWSAGTWPAARGHRPRVLVESSDMAMQWAMDRALTDAGYDVAVCDGPSVHGAPCTLVASGDCELAEGADVIVNGFTLSDRANQDVIRAVRAHRPGTPVIIDASRPEIERHPDLLDGCRFVARPLTKVELLARVSEALGDDDPADRDDGMGS